MPSRRPHRHRHGPALAASSGPCVAGRATHRLRGSALAFWFAKRCAQSIPVRMHMALQHRTQKRIPLWVRCSPIENSASFSGETGSTLPHDGAESLEGADEWARAEGHRIGRDRTPRRGHCAGPFRRVTRAPSAFARPTITARAWRQSCRPAAMLRLCRPAGPAIPGSAYPGRPT